MRSRLRREGGWPARRRAARLIGYDRAYLRLTGELRIEHDDGAQLVESHADGAR